MKLIFAVVQKEDTRALVSALVEKDISVTRIASSGGFLSSGNTTLMIGVEEELLETTLDIIRRRSSKRRAVTVPGAGTAPVRGGDGSVSPVSITIGGATVFVTDVESFYKF